MNRTRWKGPYAVKKKSGKKLIFKRSSEITIDAIGTTAWSHNGKTLVKVEVTEGMLGHKMGEFVPTRANYEFKKKKKKKK